MTVIVCASVRVCARQCVCVCVTENALYAVGNVRKFNNIFWFVCTSKACLASMFFVACHALNFTEIHSKFYWCCAAGVAGWQGGGRRHYSRTLLIRIATFAHFNVFLMSRRPAVACAPPHPTASVCLPLLVFNFNFCCSLCRSLFLCVCVCVWGSSVSWVDALCKNN